MRHQWMIAHPKTLKIQVNPNNMVPACYTFTHHLYRILRSLYFLVLWLIVPAICYSQFDDSLQTRKVSSFEGVDFLVGYMQNENLIQDSGIRLRLIIAASLPANVVITYPNGSPTPYKVAANQILNIVVPSNFEMRESEKAKKSLVAVSSDVPIAVYAFSSQKTTSDSYAVIPTNNWGKNYTVLSMPNDTYGMNGMDDLPPTEVRQSEFLIMAAFDGTKVDFKPAAPTEAGKPAGVWQSITLNKGECYLVKAIPSVSKEYDLTASQVRSDLPIAVISGHARSALPQTLPSTNDSKDHLAEWLIPDEALGTEYISVPFKTPSVAQIGDFFRVVALYPNTQLLVRTERQDLTYTLAKVGDIVNVRNLNSPAWWTADKPFTLGQYMYTGPVAGSDDFDPALAVIPPTDKFVTRSLFQTPFNTSEPNFASQYRYHYVNVICDEKARISLKLDGVNVADKIAPELLTQKHRSSNFFWAQLKIDPGKHELRCDSGVFSGTLYGMGNLDSYAHPLGFSVIPNMRDTNAPVFTVQELCGELNGKVDEVINAATSSFAYVIVDADSTQNYSFTVSNMRNNPNSVTFSAKPTDPFQDGKIFIVARDRAGNGRQYRYYYKAPRFTRTQQITLQALTEKDSLCARLYLQCPGALDSLTVYSIRLARNDQYLKVWSPQTPPFMIRPKGGVDFYVCFTPRGEGGLRIDDTVLIDIGCSRIIRVPVKVTSPTSSIMVRDVEFGDVLTGDTLCKEMTIINNGSRTVILQRGDFIQPAGMYKLDTAGFFPKTLKSGDSVRLRVCFTPVDTGNANRAVLFGNSLNVLVVGNIFGRGVKPIIEVQGIDYAKRRLGVNTDLDVVIKNSGNAAATLDFLSQDGDSGDFLHSIRKNKPFVLAGGAEVRYPVRFRASQVKNYSSGLHFSTTWRLQKEVVAELQGEGSLPTITTQNVWFDTINVGSVKTIRQVLLHAGGNEDLTIDTIRVIGKDIASFAIKKLKGGYSQLPSGSVDSVALDFTPKRKGEHIMQFVITHDANPVYMRSNDTVIIRGWARDTTKSGGGGTDTTITPKSDTLGAAISIDTDPQPYACEDAIINMRIRNTGTNDLNIQQVSLNSVLHGDTTFDLRSVFPTKLQKGSAAATATLRIPPPLSAGQLRFTLKANDTVQKVQTVSVTPIKAAASIGLIPVIAPPDSLLSVTFFGGFDSSYSQVPQRFSFSAQLPNENLQLLTQTGLLMIKDAQSQQQAAVTYRHENNRLTVTSDAELHPVSSSTWSLIIPFRTLFSPNGSSTIHVELDSTQCYQRATGEALMNIESVCAQSLRSVRMAGFEILSFGPQPAGNEFQLSLQCHTPQLLTISTTDAFGRKFLVGENLLLLNGNHSLILALNQIPSGFHSLAIESRDGIKQIPIIITK